MYEWPDTSLYHRFRNAVDILARSKGNYAHRAYSAAQQILVCAPTDFPTEELLAHYRTINELAAKAARRYEGALHFSGMLGMSARDRDQFTSAVVALFEAAAKARGANQR
ncbi:MAG: hypothetical protein NTV73_05535 [Hyphomicrobiales bacterium]|nr:hypothetical protein [Hyphomicrobiales bacterium]